MALKSAWTASSGELTPTSRDGGDPLGFRAYANRLARRLVPGLTAATSKTRGFSLLCLGAKIASQADSDGRKVSEDEARETFQRVERCWVAAQVWLLGDDATFPGKRRATRLMEEASATGEFSLTVPLLRSQLSSGVWGSYRRSSAAFGFINGASGGVTRLSATRVLGSGSELVKAFKDSAYSGTNPGHWARLDYVSIDDVLSYIDAQSEPSPEEQEIISKGIESFDAHHDRALARLRGEFDRHGGSLTLKGLDPRHLSADQAASVIEAKALVEGIQEVEFAFRDWIADENGLSVPASIRKLAIWHLAGPQEPDIARLSQVIEDSSKDTLARNILQHHRHLSMTRGAPSWEPGSGLPTVRQRILPDFTLKALRNLFDEGVRPRVDA